MSTALIEPISRKKTVLDITVALPDDWDADLYENESVFADKEDNFLSEISNVLEVIFDRKNSSPFDGVPETGSASPSPDDTLDELPLLASKGDDARSFGAGFGAGFGTGFSTGFGTSFGTGFGTGVGTCAGTGSGTDLDTGFGTGFGAGGLIVAPVCSSDGTFCISLSRLRTSCDMTMRRNQIGIAFDAWKSEDAWDTSDDWQYSANKKKQHIQFVDNCREALETNATSDERKYAIEVFGLLKALHGDAPANSAERLSVWLEQVCSSYVRQHMEATSTTMSGWIQTGDDQSQKVWDEAFWWLCARQVPQALSVIKASKLPAAPRLLMTIAAMGGSVRRGSRRLDFLADQIAKWKEQGADGLMPPGLWRIYALLSGCDHDLVSQGCPSWQLALGAHLWYRSGSSDEEGIECSMHAFEETLRSMPSKITQCRPQVPHSATNKLGPCDDMRYNLLREYVMGPKQLRDGDEAIVGIDALTYSSEPLDSWLGWSVALFMSSIRGDNREVQCYLAQLTLQFVFELEMHGEWESAIRVARFLADEDVRKRTTISLLAHVEDREEASKLAPREWVWEAVALSAAYDHDHITACDAWFKAGHTTRCVETIAQHIVLPAVLECATYRGDTCVTGPASELVQWVRDMLCRATEDRDAKARSIRQVLDDMIEGRVGVPIDSLTVFPECAWNLR